MPNLPEKKVGIVACSGEEMPEGLVSRQAVLQVLQETRRGQTVTICLPLFLAGGEGDRAFARFYPTIAVDGCEKRCAARATALYSNTPAASFVVSDFIAENDLPTPQGLRRLDAGGQQVVDALAGALADTVDRLMATRWSRSKGEVMETTPTPASRVEQAAACSCGSGIPVTTVQIDGQSIEFLALTAIFDLACAQGLGSESAPPDSLWDTVCLYNPVPQGQEDLYRDALARAWADYHTRKAKKS